MSASMFYIRNTLATITKFASSIYIDLMVPYWFFSIIQKTVSRSSIVGNMSPASIRLHTKVLRVSEFLTLVKSNLNFFDFVSISLTAHIYFLASISIGIHLLLPLEFYLGTYFYWSIFIFHVVSYYFS